MTKDTTDERPNMHGWFSKTQAEASGIAGWKLAATGEVVECTMVSRDKEHDIDLDDLQYVGEVARYVGPLKSVERPPNPFAGFHSRMLMVGRPDLVFGRPDLGDKIAYLLGDWDD